ncbi:general amidase [Cristinia sonorae]|uniref:General amidase n=1 Tax=Cristinia sonorae TaxID=1940300 RepID=A0A8K0UT83_9AGAR|nr:general amidase [Cristinia sonorae]
MSSSDSTPQVSWEDKVKAKRHEQQQFVPSEWMISPIGDNITNVLDIPNNLGLLSPNELQITASDVSTLLRNLSTSVWSSVEVTTAFAKRAIIAHQLTNCLTEIFVDDALKRAAELDEHLKQTGSVVGPLHGLPISLKDQFCIKGIDATMGYVAWIGKPAQRDSAIVKLLIQSGAVLYVKTNVPQTLMWGETLNNVFGRTLNPHNIGFTSGGSTGGEGSLIAQRGSVLGVGTDIAGSIRIPSHYNGVYGFKPSTQRVPTFGMVNSLDGQDSIGTTAGPLSVSIEGLKHFMQAVLSSRPWMVDPNVIRKPWDQDAYELKEHGNGQKLCFGILWDDGHLKPHPPINRALQMAKQALEKAGHNVIDWVPQNHRELNANARSIFLADGSADYLSGTTPSGEPLLYSMKPGADPNEIPPFRKPRQPLSAFELWQLHKERRELRQKYFDHWNATDGVSGTGRPVDAIIAPAMPYTALPHGMTGPATYTLVMSTLDCPSLTIPVTKVDPALDIQPPPHEFRGSDDEDLYNIYDAERFAGMPVGLQLVGQRHEEEAVLAMGAILDDALKSL